ncbi:MAG: hypothetical protein K2N48_14335 [Muribaculaceae bacterium]|nr:hypothetical protein [Muribaculaceae bacterium]
MKKFYENKIKFLAAMAFVLMTNVAVGQSFKVTSNGNPVANNDIIEVPYEYEDYSVPEADYYQYVYAWYPEIEVSSNGGTLSLSASVTASDTTDGFQICWPSQCKFVNPGGTEESSGTVGTEPENLSIHREINIYSKEDVSRGEGELKVKLVAGSETMEFTLKCQGFEFNAVGENLAETNVVPEYYNIQGVRVAEPQKGQIVIERKGSKVTKRVF